MGSDRLLENHSKLRQMIIDIDVRQTDLTERLLEDDQADIEYIIGRFIHLQRKKEALLRMTELLPIIY